MRQMNNKFENWYNLTHWMSPPLTKRGDNSYENSIVQAMYISYRAGYNRATKDMKTEEKKIKKENEIHND